MIKVSNVTFKEIYLKSLKTPQSKSIDGYQMEITAINNSRENKKYFELLLLIDFYKLYTEDTEI